MPELIIADASCLIVLTKIGQLDLLRQLYGTATTTPTVAAEYGLPLPAWLRQEAATDDARQQLLALLVDAGEASAIALALERPGCTLILDDYKARKTAERLIDLLQRHERWVLWIFGDENFRSGLKNASSMAFRVGV